MNISVNLIEEIIYKERTMGKIKDLTGKKFGRLTVIRYAGRNKFRRAMWLCKCECGNEFIANSGRLLNGSTQSCGCLHQDIIIKDLTGKKFGKLSVIKKVGTDKFRRAMWLCKCECGETIVVPSNRIQCGDTKSCGCLHHKHGLTKHPLYKVWANIKNRCYDINNIGYHNYGGRGIEMCKEWLNSFETFYNWAMNNGYKKGLTIDRVDVNGNYEPNNCRWVNMKIQSNNKRNNRYLTVNGETHTIQEWREIKGLGRGVIDGRIKAGWTPEQAVNTPPKHRRNYL